MNEFAEEDIDAKKKKIIKDTREHIDSVDEIISLHNPRLKKSIDAAKNEIRDNSRQPHRK